MNRSQLIRLVSQRQHIPQRAAEALVKAIFAEIQAALTRKRSVTITGFGTFAPRFKDSCTRRNPRTGEPMLVGPRWGVRFKAGRKLKTALVEAE
jgi:nucleoid DNA-binding protein